MELFIRLDPAQLQRFRAQPILKSCRISQGKTSVEQGVLFDSADYALQRRGIFVTIIHQGKRLVEIVEREDAAPTRRFVASIEPPLPPEDLPTLHLQALFDYRAIRGQTLLGGNLWRAEMIIEQIAITAGDRRFDYCRIGFRLLEGGSAPLTALLQSLADRVPLRLTGARRWAIASQELQNRPNASVKAKTPPIPADASNSAALRLIATSGLNHLLANQDCLMASGDAEAIHQMRVALRRLRSALSLFKIMLNDPQSQALRAELRWMQQMLGAARDNDVLLADILQPLDRLLQFTPGYEELRQHIDQLRQVERDSMLREVQAPRFAKSLLRLACWLEDIGEAHPMGDEPVRSLALATLNRRYRRVRKQMAQFHNLDEVGRHECRIEIKKLRYAIDFFGNILSDRRTNKFVGQLASLQDDLGRLNDIATARRLLQQIALQTPHQPVAWAAGLVVGWHINRTNDLLNQAWDHWHEVEKSPQFWKVEPDGFK